MLPMSAAKPFGGAIIAIVSLLLGACLFSPGKFVSSLDVRRDGTFTYSYTGEIYLLALSKIAELDGSAKYEPRPCYDGDTGQEKRCSAMDLTEQRMQWEAERASSAARRKREAEQMKAVFGGIDMSSPRAAEEIAARLRRQAGWRRVDYKGDGLFEVDFSLTGRLDHDFAFPTVEQFPMANAFVQVSRRKDGAVRIDAPGFGPGAGGEPLRSMAKAAAAGGEKSPELPLPDGRFTITTDAAILSNNTDEGPQPAPGGQKLEWTVNLRSSGAPMALVRLAAP